MLFAAQFMVRTGMAEKKIHHSKRGVMEKKTILIVEDDGVLGLQLKNMLANLGYNTPEPVATGEEAIAAVCWLSVYLS